MNFWATIYLRVTKTTASQLKETMWTQRNVLGATGVALSLLLHSSHRSANSRWGTRQPCDTSGSTAECEDALNFDLPSSPLCMWCLHALSSENTQREATFFFFVFPQSYQGDKNVKTVKGLPGDGFNYFLAPFPVVTAELEWQITTSCQRNPLKRTSGYSSP